MNTIYHVFSALLGLIVGATIMALIMSSSALSTKVVPSDLVKINGGVFRNCTGVVLDANKTTASLNITECKEIQLSTTDKNEVVNVSLDYLEKVETRVK